MIIFFIVMIFVGCLINLVFNLEMCIKLFCFILILINVLKLIMFWIVFCIFIFGFKFFIVNMFLCKSGVDILLCILWFGWIKLVIIFVSVFELIFNLVVNWFIGNCFNFLIVFVVFNFLEVIFVFFKIVCVIG